MAKNKLNLSLLLNFSVALAGASRALEYGFGIHGRDQLSHARSLPETLLWSDTLNGVMRHLMLWFMGQRKDPESGEDHLDHAISRLLFLSTAQKLDLGTNDLHLRFDGEEITILKELLNGTRKGKKEVVVSSKERKASNDDRIQRRGGKLSRRKSETHGRILHRSRKGDRSH